MVKRLATLVGCNYLPEKPSIDPLDGCINDVKAIRELLIARFGFQSDDIVVLTDEPGSAVHPTGANILHVLHDMVETAAKPGDILLFHFSGHGVVVPASLTRSKLEEEAIVSCDINLITRQSFRALVNLLPAGASLTITADCCHSGGLIENETEQIGPNVPSTVRPRSIDRNRSIPIESVLEYLSTKSNLPSSNIMVDDHLEAVFGSDAITTYEVTRTRRGRRPRSIPPDHGILLSGCQSNEKSKDIDVEKNGKEVAHGAFTYSIIQTLEEVKNARELSNRELVTHTREWMQVNKYKDQHPCLYCSEENADAPYLQNKPVKPQFPSNNNFSAVLVWFS